MYSPEDIERARRGASFHLEICVERNLATSTQPGRVLVQGRVTQFFRGDDAIRIGSPVSFWVESQNGGQRSPPGDDVRLRVEDIVAGKYMEAYFSRRGSDAAGVSRLEVALRQVAVYSVSSAIGRL